MVNGASTTWYNLLEASFNHWHVNGNFWNIHIRAKLYVMVIKTVKINPQAVKYDIELKLVYHREKNKAIIDIL